MEGGGEQPSLANQDGESIDPGEHLDLVSEIPEPWSPDEDAAEALEPRGGTRIHLGGEGVHLGSIGISDRRHVQEAQRFNRVPVHLHLAAQEDRTGTGPEDREAGPPGLPKRRVEPQPVETLGDGGALTTREDQRVQALEILLPEHRNRLAAQPFHRSAMRLHIPLDRQDPDPGSISHPLATSRDWPAVRSRRGSPSRSPPSRCRDHGRRSGPPRPPASGWWRGRPPSPGPRDPRS